MTTEGPVLSDSEAEVLSYWEVITKELPARPLKALETYNQAIASSEQLVKDRLQDIFGSTMDYLECGRQISHDELHRAVTLYASARTADRLRLIAAAVDQLILLGEGAHNDPVSREAAVLEGIARAFNSLVLDGPVQQTLCSRLAIQLGLKWPERSVPPGLSQVARQLVEALITALKVGDPTTRDAAVEGLGAILRFFENPAELFRAEIAEAVDEVEGQPSINRLYFERLRRRRLIVLAVAGHRESCGELFDALREPIGSATARIRASAPAAGMDRGIQEQLYERADLLRSLPAVHRQTRGKQLPASTIELLCDAASLRTMSEDDPPATLTAFARYQESVFRTIDVTIKRRTAPPSNFDKVVAEAVKAIPPTMVGPAALCNAQVRATVAILRTAVRLVEEASLPATTEALRVVFYSLDQPSRWVNLGIREGCYRSLPFLLKNPAHNKMVTPVLESLFEQLRKRHDSPDLTETHKQLVANACFRRLLILRMERAEERRLTFESATEKQLSLLRMNRDMKTLLHEPYPEAVLDVFQDRGVPDIRQRQIPRGVAEIVIAGTTFESDLLRRSTSLFEGWSRRSPAEKLLLTRILAAQLRAASHDAREIARFDLLRRVYAGIQTVSLAESERLRLIIDLLSAVPSEAAEAADPDLRSFLEQLGMDRGEQRGDLVASPLMYVIAMIPGGIGGRILDAVAREIDLNLRRERARSRTFDLAVSLYQVMSRGVDYAVFDHLLPRVRERADRDVVVIFRVHATGLGHAPREIRDVVRHVDHLLAKLDGTRSVTLQRFAKVLIRYRKLALEDESVWPAIAHDQPGGGLGALLGEIDDIDATTRFDGTTESQQRQLAPDYHDWCLELQEAVSDYLELPVGRFGARTRALTRAREVAERFQLALSSRRLPVFEGIMLMALAQWFHDLFDRTIRSYCEEPRRLMEKDDRHSFWVRFACEPAEAVAGPPPYPGQRMRFERFFVDWMSAELEIDALSRALKDRWSLPFRILYAIMTDLRWISVVILTPFFITITLHLVGRHSVEGIGFFIQQVAVLMAFLAVFSPSIPALSVLPKDKRPARPQYRFRCLFPRMAGLIAAPMALIVEFDHAYDFPLHASTGALLSLMIVAFFSLRFSITQEIVNDEGRPFVEPTLRDRAKVKEIVAVAIAHSFAIAFLLAVIFAASHIGHGPSGQQTTTPHSAPTPHTRPAQETHDQPALLRWTDWLGRPADNGSRGFHRGSFSRRAARSRVQRRGCGRLVRTKPLSRPGLALGVRLLPNDPLVVDSARHPRRRRAGRIPQRRSHPSSARRRKVFLSRSCVPFVAIDGRR